MRVLLNGLGRIGRSILKIALERQEFEIVAINELNQNIENIAYSINYDSSYGRYHTPFEFDDDTIYNTQTRIAVWNKKTLFDIDFGNHAIDIVIDASGVSSPVDQLRGLDVKAIFLTHPNARADINVILGVNGDMLDLHHHKIISTSSCNATALLPILKIIDEHFGIEYGDITTIHPLLNHQKLLDGGCVGDDSRHVTCNFEFGRAATENIIPSKTTVIEACSYILPHVNAEIFSSNSFRVPTATVGAIDAVFCIKKECSREQLLALCYDYEARQTDTIIRNNTKALVSGDFKAEPYTTIIDHRFSDVKMHKMIKLVLWYDNEWGYASKVVDIVVKAIGRRNA
jgi:glyceraldehyde 3-phosphate dehydrogenase